MTVYDYRATEGHYKFVSIYDMFSARQKILEELMSRRD